MTDLNPCINCKRKRVSMWRMERYPMPPLEDVHYLIVCEHCHYGVHASTPEVAIEKWNRRVKE